MSERTKVGIKHRDSRVVLSEVLPYEVPVLFSNLGFYRFLNRSRFVQRDSEMLFRTDTSATKTVLKIIFGKSASIEPTPGGSAGDFTVKVNARRARTMPFQFQIRHKKKESRLLSIPHPAAQMELVKFYGKHRSLLVYHSGKSNFSVRHPFRIARYTSVNDYLFRSVRAQSSQVEEDGHEYDQLRSYFVYKKYDNIYKFHESNEYRASEKKFGHLLRLDISKCFDSVYTHSVAWAIHGRDVVKKDPRLFDLSFAGEFDGVMQRMNDNETHGILIGPEISRIFAEIILQSVDVAVEASLAERNIVHGRDYEILRYVDDYFIFMADTRLRDEIVNDIEAHLRPLKLSLNGAKEEINTTPFISDLSIAKEKLNRLLDDELRVGAMAVQVPDGEAISLNVSSSAERLISGYKTILRETNLGPLEFVNYTLASLEGHAERLLARVMEEHETSGGTLSLRELTRPMQQEVTQLLLDVIDFCFYVYGGSPRVAPGIKTARLVTLCRKAATEFCLSLDRRASLDDAVFKEVTTQLSRNPLSESASVESLYLLALLGDLDSHYRLEEEAVCRYLGIGVKNDRFEIPKWFNAFSIFATLDYIGDLDQFERLRADIEAALMDRIVQLNGHGRPSAEQVILVLDALASPYVTKANKGKIVRSYEKNATSQDVQNVINYQARWFTRWDKSDLYAELRLKKVHEVY